MKDILKNSLAQDPHVRFFWMDVLRFFLAFGVFVSHFLETFIVRIYGYNDLYGVGNLECALGGFCVLTFFVLSGYVIAYSTYSSFSQNKFDFFLYIKKRIFRIYPVAWGALMLAFMWWIVMYSFDLHGIGENGFKLEGDITWVPKYVSLTSILYNVFLPPVGYQAGFLNIALWSLSYEMSFYVIYGILLKLILRFGLKQTVSLLSLLMIYFFIWYYVTVIPNRSYGQGFLTFLCNFPCWNFMPFFLIWSLGVVLFFYTKLKISRVFLCLPPIGIAVFLLIFFHQVVGVPLNFNMYPNLSIYSTPPYGFWIVFSYTLLIASFFIWLI